MPGSGIHITQAQITGFGAATYVLGACIGALLFGWLTERFGRKRLFMITLGTYQGALSATTMTACWCALLFSALVSTGKVADTVLAFSIGASLMVLAGIVEIFLGVRAERRGSEDIAQPLTAADVEPRPRQARAAT